MNTDLWFPPRDKEKYKSIADIAKNICYGRDGFPECPVRKECLLYAERNEDTHGIGAECPTEKEMHLKEKQQNQD